MKQFFKHLFTLLTLIVLFTSIEIYGQHFANLEKHELFNKNKFTVFEHKKTENIDNLNHYSLDLREYVNPVRTKCVNSHFGYRARFRRHHAGVDLKGNIGDTIYAAFNGIVNTSIGKDSNKQHRGYGKYVVISHTEKIETLYAHMSKVFVNKDQYVQAGDPIGLVGSTGRSTGPHLHFEFIVDKQKINPELLFDFLTHMPKITNFSYKKK